MHSPIIFKSMHYFDPQKCLRKTIIAHCWLIWINLDVQIVTFREFGDKNTQNTFGKHAKSPTACFVVVVSQAITFLQ